MIRDENDLGVVMKTCLMLCFLDSIAALLIKNDQNRQIDVLHLRSHNVTTSINLEATPTHGVLMFISSVNFEAGSLIIMDVPPSQNPGAIGPISPC